MERPFVHLHCHSEYSILDGAGRLKHLVQRTAELGMNALALTDHGNLYGIRKFYRLAREANIKPILGYEAYVAPGSRFEKHADSRKESAYHLTVLAMNHQGYKNLLQMATLADFEGFYYRPRIDRELLTRYGEGLIILSGCISGEVNRALSATDEPNWEKARAAALWYKEAFGDRYYFEIQNNGIAIQQTATRYMVQLAQECDIPLVATSDVHYVLPKDAETQDILLCINTGRLRSDQSRMRMETKEFYLRSPEEMYEAFPGLEDAVARSQEIADRCDVELESGKRCFPVYQPPDGLSSMEFLRNLALEGLRKNYAEMPKYWKDQQIGGELSDEVMERFDKELSVIERQGFPNYFLIVWDFVRVAHERGIACTARGSCVGSLVCFGLGISKVCPLEYKLLFERFLDISRKEAPDIDIDFEKERRGEILQYVKDVYGEKNVAQLGTFGTMAAKAAIKDVGRVLGLPIPRVAAVTALVPDAPKTTLEKAFKDNPELQKLCDRDSEIQELMQYARGCEGLVRQTSTHACAIVITPAPVVEFAPLQMDKNRTGVTTQWEQAEVEESGLLKMDFLGLRNLTILSETMQLIEKTTGQKLDPYCFPMDDRETYALISRGETLGVFQMESAGFRKFLRNLRPDCFRDIIAASAMYRPGPLDGGLVDTYIQVKHGLAEAEYLHPVMEDELKETHGVMVYQEQVMRILHRLGKIELPDAYKCIKAIGKKKGEIIARYMAQFVAGCQENNLTEKDGNALFKLIDKFAGYGFNKSHSTAYAKIAFMTAYLKCHFPAEFMTALLTGDIAGRNFAKQDKTVLHVRDCHRMKVEVVPPDVNTSAPTYRIEDGKIYFALLAIKGCSEMSATAIYEDRQKNGPFTDLFNFCERLSAKQVPRATLLSLLYAGALDSFHARRAQLEAVLDQAIQAGQRKAADREIGQLSLFDMGNEEAETGSEIETILPDVPEWPDQERLLHEKEVLGFYVSGHPLGEFRTLTQRHCTHTIEELADLPDKTQVVVYGMITDCRQLTTKKDQKTFGSFTLEGEFDQVRAVLWPSQFEEYGHFLVPETIVACVGTVDKPKQEQKKVTELAAQTMHHSGDDDDDDSDDLDAGMLEEEDDVVETSASAAQSIQLMVEQIVSMPQLKNDFNDGLVLCLREEEHTPETVKMLHEILRSVPGNESVRLICLVNERRVQMNCEMRVQTTPDLLRRVRDLLGEKNVWVITRLLRPEPREERSSKWRKKSS